MSGKLDTTNHFDSVVKISLVIIEKIYMYKSITEGKKALCQNNINLFSCRWRKMMMLMNIVAIALASLMKRKTKPTRERRKKRRRRRSRKKKWVQTTLRYILAFSHFFFASSSSSSPIFPYVFAWQRKRNSRQTIVLNEYIHRDDDSLCSIVKWWWWE